MLGPGLGVGGEDTGNAAPFERTLGAALEAAGPKEPAGWMGRQAWGVEVSGGLNGWSWGGLGGLVPEAGELVRDGAPVALQGAEAVRHPVPARRQAGEQRSEDSASAAAATMAPLRIPTASPSSTSPSDTPETSGRVPDSSIRQKVVMAP